MGLSFRGMLKFFSVRAFEGIVAVLLITFMPNIPPNAKYSQSYSVTPSLPLEGKLALNERLNQAEIWHKGDFLGPEAFAEYNGELYTTLHGGDIVKLTGNHITPVVKFGKPCKGVYQEQICGRPLGLTFDKNGALYAADAYYGIFKVDVKTGKKLQLVSVDHEIAGKKPKLPNSLVVASNGDLYWTDSSTEFTLQDGVFDVFADGSGRLIHYDAKTKKNTVLIDGLHFANGVMLSSDENFIIVAETARSRIHRYYLKGPKKGTSDIFIDGLPGFPDNLHSDGQSGFLVPLVTAKDEYHPSAFQILGPFPLARKFLSRLLGLAQLGFKVVDQVYPNEWAERGIHFVGHFSSLSFVLPKRVTVLHVSKSGEILDSLHALDKKISGISEAFIFKDYLYLGSPFNDYIARVPLAKAGLRHLAISKQQTQKPAVHEAPPTVQLPSKSSTTTQAPPTPKQATQAPPPAPTTEAPKATAPPSTQPPKQPQPTTNPPKQPPTTASPVKQQPPTTAPPVKQQPPTTAPPVKQQPPTTAPPVKQQPPTTAPPPKASPTPKQVPPTTSPPVKQQPPTTALPPKASPTPKQVPPTTSSPPLKQTASNSPSSQQTLPTTAPPPSKQTPPKQSSPITQSPPKQTSSPTTQSPSKQSPPSNQAQTQEQPKVVSGKESPKNAK